MFLFALRRLLQTVPIRLGAPRCRYAMDACRRGQIPVVTTEAGALTRYVWVAELVGA
jgi:hypothetical protein